MILSDVRGVRTMRVERLEKEKQRKEKLNDLLGKAKEIEPEIEHEGEPITLGCSLHGEQQTKTLVEASLESGKSENEQPTAQMVSLYYEQQNNHVISDLASELDETFTTKGNKEKDEIYALGCSIKS